MDFSIVATLDCQHVYVYTTLLIMFKNVNISEVHTAFRTSKMFKMYRKYNLS